MISILACVAAKIGYHQHQGTRLVVIFVGTMATHYDVSLRSIFGLCDDIIKRRSRVIMRASFKGKQKEPLFTIPNITNWQTKNICTIEFLLAH